MDKIYQIYDKAYHQLFSNHELFRELLETFVNLDWVKQIDFSKLERIDKSFIAEDYKKKESDIIYKAILNDNTEMYIYILLEFQSSVDKFMPIRCLNYITNIYLEMIKSQGESITLPPVFPLVLYNGDDKWNHSNKAQDFIKNNDILGKYGINFEIFLLKENDFSLDHLLEIGNIVSTLFITESHYDSELIFNEIQKILDKYGITIPVKLFLNYFKQMAIDQKVATINYKELEKLYKTKEEVNSMLLTAVRKEKQDIINQKQDIMNEKQEIINQKQDIIKKKQELINLGKFEGEVIGIQKGKQDFVIRLLNKKFGSIPSDIENKVVNCHDIVILDKIADSIFDITSYDEVKSILN